MTTMIEADSLIGAVVELETLTDGKQVWVAKDPVLDGCLAQAGSREEALAALEEARKLYLAAMKNQQSVRQPVSRTFVNGSTVTRSA